MHRCCQFRYIIVVLTGVGVFLIMCFRITFVLVLTDTTRSNGSDVNDVSFYPNCTTYNSTDRDYVNHFSKETGIQFHSVYFVGMFIGITASGHLTSRFPANNIIGLGILISSLLFLLLPVIFQYSAVGVFVVRLLQGVTEGMIHPAVMTLVTTWSLRYEKSTLLALAFFGLHIGPGLSNIFIGACLCYISWHSGMYILGTLGTLWSLAWFCIATSTPTENSFVGSQELEKFAIYGEGIAKGSKSIAENIPWRSILTSKHVWAIWVANFCKNVVNTTIMTLQPQFFKDVFHLRVADIGLLLSIPFFLATCCVFTFCLISDKLIKFQVLSVTNVRKLMQCAGVTAETVFFICMAYSVTWQMTFVFLTLGFSLGQMTFAGYSCNLMDLSPQYSGAVSAVAITGIVGGVANTFIASYVIGANSTAANWTIMFWIEALVAACTGVFYFLFASGEIQPWASGLKKVNGTKRLPVDGKVIDSEVQPLLEHRD